MGELRGRPDTPPEEPEAPAPDRAPAYPHVEVGYVTDRDPDLSPASLRPYRTSRDRPEPQSEPERPDELDARTLEVERPPADNPFERDATDSPFTGDAAEATKFDERRRRVWENIDEVTATGHKIGETADSVLGRVRPTGQYVRDNPHDPLAEQLSPPHGIDGGGFAAAMLAGGLVLGEVTRWAYRRSSELRESWNART